MPFCALVHVSYGGINNSYVLLVIEPDLGISLIEYRTLEKLGELK